ncbi:N-acetyltransferase [Marinomonas agarivorans]|nr:N-acetyltransferase [Marinomonas agarivorans]
MTPQHLRQAYPDELQALISIDDNASQLYAEAGLVIEFESDHPFVVDESVRWAEAIQKGLAYVVTNEYDTPIGFMTLDFVDQVPYLDQLAVHPDYMRQGVGSRLLDFAIAWSDKKPLWLTTYSHIAWNKPYYEKHGFTAVPEEGCGPQLRDILNKQRAALPAPEQRIAMVLLINQVMA